MCYLNKTLYRLKQPQRAWFSKFSCLVAIDFTFIKSDTSLSMMDTPLYLVILVYVDDILLTGNSPLVVQNLITKLCNALALKDFGSLNYFLRNKVVIF